MSPVDQAKNIVEFDLHRKVAGITTELLADLLEYIELVEGQNHDLSLENDGLREELYLLERSFYYREEEDAA